MFIANDSNYTFGQYLDRETVDITAPVYTKCFTDTEELKGYRFVHDPEETNPEKCVSFSIYDIGSETATATPFFEKAVVSDLTTVMFRLDAYILDDSPIRDKPFYHVIVPVENIADGTLKYLVIMMTKEVEIFPENYPYYELADSFADAQPTSADAPSGGGGEGGGGESDLSIANITVNKEGITALSDQWYYTFTGGLVIGEEATYTTEEDYPESEIPAEYVLKVMLYKGSAKIYCDYDQQHIRFNVVGAQSLGDGVIEITQDASIDFAPAGGN